MAQKQSLDLDLMVQSGVLTAELVRDNINGCIRCMHLVLPTLRKVPDLPLVRSRLLRRRSGLMANSRSAVILSEQNSGEG